MATRSKLQCILLTVFCGLAAAEGSPAGYPNDYVAGGIVELNDNGAWSWFMDERAIVDRGKLIVGSVRAVGTFSSGKNDPNWGNVEIAVYDVQSGKVSRTILHERLEQDDHDSPAFLVLSDGRYLAVYSKHAVERAVYHRTSQPAEPLEWGVGKVFVPPGEDTRYGGDNVTYSNLFRMPDGRIFNFYRGFSHDPNYMVSDDEGLSWKYGGRVLQGRDGYSPYLKYASIGRGTIHFIVTEDHPRNYDNSIYHGWLRDGEIHGSDGTRLAKLSETTTPSLSAWDLTKVFGGDPDNVAWTVDIELDSQERPYIAFSVQKDGRGLPPRQGGNDLRYCYGRWDGTAWHVHPMAYAGTRLYPFEDDYSGLVALDPHRPGIAYISSDADPATGQPLISQADGRRHYELFQGRSFDGGATWQWRQITANSTVDNLRPLVPKWEDERTALVWMRGSYHHNHGQWTTAVVATILPPGQPPIPLYSR